MNWASPSAILFEKVSLILPTDRGHTRLRQGPICECDHVSNWTVVEVGSLATIANFRSSLNRRDPAGFLSFFHADKFSATPTVCNYCVNLTQSHMKLCVYQKINPHLTHFLFCASWPKCASNTLWRRLTETLYPSLLPLLIHHSAHP